MFFQRLFLIFCALYVGYLQGADLVVERRPWGFKPSAYFDQCDRLIDADLTLSLKAETIPRNHKAGQDLPSFSHITHQELVSGRPRVAIQVSSPSPAIQPTLDDQRIRLSTWRELKKNEFKEVKTFEQFLGRYSLPPEIEDCIKKNHTQDYYYSPEVCSKNVCTKSLFKKPPRKVSGYDLVERIMFAERLRNFIAQNKITRCVVPEKYICRLNNGTRNSLSVYAEKMEGRPIFIPKKLIPDDNKYGKPYGEEENLLPDEEEELKKIIENTKYCDFNPCNIIRILDDNKGSRIAFIDTERISFGDIHGSIKYKAKLDSVGCDFKEVMRDLIKKFEPYLDHYYLEERLKKLFDGPSPPLQLLPI